MTGRERTVLWILSSLVVGVVLVFAPWWPSLWDSNWLLQLLPSARGLLLSAFTRGAVTGLGLVNLVLAAGEGRRFGGPKASGPLFVEKDCSLAEINPLVETPDGQRWFTLARTVDRQGHAHHARGFAGVHQVGDHADRAPRRRRQR